MPLRRRRSGCGADPLRAHVRAPAPPPDVADAQRPAALARLPRALAARSACAIATQQDGYNAIAFSSVRTPPTGAPRRPRRRVGTSRRTTCCWRSCSRAVAAHVRPLTVPAAQRDRGRVDRQYPSRPRDRGRSERAGAVSGLVPRCASGADDGMHCATSPRRCPRSDGRVKREKRYLQTLFAHGALPASNGASCRCRSASVFLPKHFPVCAGTTPLNVDPLWSGGGARRRAGLRARRFHRPACADGRGVYHGGRRASTSASRSAHGIRARDAVEGVAADMLQPDHGRFDDALRP